MSNKVVQEPEKSTKPLKSMTKAEIFQKIIADQQVITEALQKGVPLKELEKTHGFQFARLQNIAD